MAVIDQNVTEDYALYHADCMDVLAEMPRGSIHHSIFSPPFVDLFCYSDSERDLGNISDYGAFLAQVERLGKLLLPAMMPGRIAAVHCMDLPITKEREGVIGIRDFPGDLIRAFVSAGFIYHGRVTIWKDPLIAAVRTKAIGLMHKQLVKDSALSRPGIADYLIMFRAPGDNPIPIPHPDGLTRYAGSEDPGGVGVKRSHFIWRAYASPVWMDIRQSNVLAFRDAQDERDEKHLCPLQLDVIERCVTLWSNPGETVFTPFMGCGSEVCGALANWRRGIGVELKDTYYRQAVKNVEAARLIRRSDQTALFEVGEGA